jgi:hypothetical protein
MLFGIKVVWFQIILPRFGDMISAVCQSDIPIIGEQIPNMAGKLTISLQFPGEGVILSSIYNPCSGTIIVEKATHIPGLANHHIVGRKK